MKAQIDHVLQAETVVVTQLLERGIAQEVFYTLGETNLTALRKLFFTPHILWWTAPASHHRLSAENLLTLNAHPSKALLLFFLSQAPAIDQLVTESKFCNFSDLITFACQKPQLFALYCHKIALVQGCVETRKLSSFAELMAVSEDKTPQMTLILEQMLHAIPPLLNTWSSYIGSQPHHLQEHILMLQDATTIDTMTKDFSHSTGAHFMAFLLSHSPEQLTTLLQTASVSSIIVPQMKAFIDNALGFHYIRAVAMEAMPTLPDLCTDHIAGHLGQHTGRRLACTSQTVQNTATTFADYIQQSRAKANSAGRNTPQ